MTFWDKVIEFNKNLDYKWKLPEKFSVLNPYLDNPETIIVMQEFYKKYYNDNKKRKFIIWINPSRHWAGVTGVPFTDTKRLESVCGIKMTSVKTHEVSSVFIYDLIEAFWWAKEFYSKFYINSPFPLAIVKNTEKGVKNANYYDEKELFEDVKDFMIESLKKHISLWLEVDEVFVLWKKNSDFINNINKEQKLFWKITVLEHPRYIEQYKSKEKKYFIEKYLKELKK